MLKLDQNLKKVVTELVPDFLEEEEFWHNYFYFVHCMLSEVNILRLEKKIKLPVEVE